VQAGRRGAADLLAAEPGLTALLCMTDQLARGALQAATDRGMRVPADLSVAGFDDLNEAAGTEPPLTTVRQDPHRQGRPRRPRPARPGRRRGGAAKRRARRPNVHGARAGRCERLARRSREQMDSARIPSVALIVILGGRHRSMRVQGLGSRLVLFGPTTAQSDSWAVRLLVGVDRVGVVSPAAGIDWASGSFQVWASSRGVR
jgi:hypothetical protein